MVTRVYVTNMDAVASLWLVLVGIQSEEPYLSEV